MNAMEITLIEGNFSATDSIDLLSQLIESKIKFHENKIEAGSEEEDIKFRESKITALQNQLSNIKEELALKQQNVDIVSNIKIS